MAIYNESFMNSTTNIVDIITNLNTQLKVDFLIGNMLLISFFTIFLVLSYRHNFMEVLMLDCFLTSLIAMLLFYAGLVAIYSLILPLSFFIVFVIFYIFLN